MGSARSARLLRLDPDRQQAADRERPDVQLMARVGDGDPSAFQALLDLYWGPLVRYARGMVGGEDSAEDVVQEVFVRVWQHRTEWSAEGSVRAYLFRITRNLSLNHVRDRDAEVKRRETAGYTLVPARWEGRPDEQLARSTLEDEVAEAVAALPPRRREAFVLSRYHGLSYREVADTMGLAEQTVANQMRRALAELRIALSHHLLNEP